jgi:hypothetical protein
MVSLVLSFRGVSTIFMLWYLYTCSMPSVLHVSVEPGVCDLGLEARGLTLRAMGEYLA